MALREWHWGQLLIFWVVSALVGLAIGGPLYARGLLFEPDEPMAPLPRDPAHGHLALVQWPAHGQVAETVLAGCAQRDGTSTHPRSTLFASGPRSSSTPRRSLRESGGCGHRNVSLFMLKDGDSGRSTGRQRPHSRQPHSGAKLGLVTTAPSKNSSQGRWLQPTPPVQPRGPASSSGPRHPHELGCPGVV